MTSRLLRGTGFAALFAGAQMLSTIPSTFAAEEPILLGNSSTGAMSIAPAWAPKDRPKPAMERAEPQTVPGIMLVGGLTSQPIGHYEYCKREYRDCNIRARSTAPVKLTRARWAEMVQANARANSQVRPVTDMEYYGTEEHWVMPTRDAGDCEDYALMKRAELLSQGWPASALLVTVVRQENGDGHAVLTVRTDRGDYILDNLNGRILPWHETEYSYLKRVSAAHSGQWESIIDSRTLVGSAK